MTSSLPDKSKNTMVVQSFVYLAYVTVTRNTFMYSCPAGKFSQNGVGCGYLMAVTGSTWQ